MSEELTSHTVTATERIAWHAGLSEAGALPPGSVSAVTSGGDPADIEAATTDFIGTLDKYNRELNGPVPSETVDPRDDSVPRSLAYAVGEVVRMLRASGSDRAALRVETTWQAVLAGDVDDIDEHLVEEGIE
jgi:hypothetical protein